jgi:diguanylate cyclase (GGDEF)-like protein
VNLDDKLATRTAGSETPAAAATGAPEPTVEMDPAAILTALDAVVYDWDIPSDRLVWSPNIHTTLSGFPRGALATGAGYNSLISKDSETSRYQAVQNGLASDEGQGAPFRVTYRLESAVGGPIEVEDLGRWFEDGSGRPCRVHGIVRVSSRATTAGPASNVISANGLDETLCTRRAFNEWVDARCAEARIAGTHFLLLMIGITNLSAINRRDGYDAADELILGLGRRLAKSLRAGDKLVRYSGGKFALLIALGAADRPDVAAARLARHVNLEPFATSAGARRGEIRVGAALAPRHGRNAHLLLQRAEEALEQAEAARAPYGVYSPDDALGEARRRETRIADEIVAALNERRVVIAFQPVRPTGASGQPFEEALLRIRQDDGKIIGPATVIPVAERLGMIELLDERVLELTLDCLAADPLRRLSMNVSYDTLRAPDWLDRLKGRLAARPGAAERLTVEIIETRAIEDLEGTSSVLRRMKDFGLRIAMDDFGAGHTSFRNLRALCVDMVKIDGAFIQNLLGSVDDRFFVRTLAELARHLGVETVAEWVEDVAAIPLLREWGVGYVQGHGIAPARLPAFDAAGAPPARAAVGPSPTSR